MEKVFDSHGLICKISGNVTVTSGGIRVRFTSIVAAAFACLVSFGAHASTVMADGGSYNLASSSVFTYTDYSSSAAAADQAFTFQFQSGGTPGAYAYSIFLDAFSQDVSTFTAVWSSAAGGTGTILSSVTLNTAGLLNGLIDASTNFSAVDPQWLTISWTGDANRDALISVQVSAVPLPASALLLLAGLGGFAFTRRRRLI